MLDRGWLAPDPEIGQEVPSSLPRSFRDYEIIEEIARGGMGVVYTARQRSLNRIVALKMILTGRLAGEAELRRFRAEAEMAAGLQHPNIVAIHEVGEHDGQPFFSMEYVLGKNLAELCYNEPLDAQHAAAYLKTIAAAIQYAHSRGVLHRDLKPSNILIDQNNQPRITDFGLARRLDDSRLLTINHQLTLTGQILGSPNFMSPEQAAGDRKAVGPQSDIYSLGAILYQLLTRRPPFIAETIAQTLRLVAESEPIAPRLLNPTVPRDLETICLKCLQKVPQKRYESADGLVNDLDCFLHGRPITARPVGQSEKVWRWSKRYPLAAGLGIAVLILLITMLISSLTYVARLKAANRQSQERLRDAYIGQAKATRWSGQAGRRFEALDLLAKASQIRTSTDIRNQAIACLALQDIHTLSEIKLPPGRYLNFDSGYERCAFADRKGHILVRRVADGKDLIQLPASGNGDAFGRFDPANRYLLVVHDDPPNMFLAYNLKTLEQIFAVSNCPVGALEISSSGDRAFIALNTTPSPLRSYSMPSGTMQTLRELPVPPSQMRLNPAGDQLAVIENATKEVAVYDASTGELLFRMPQPGPAGWLDWHPSGRLLVTAVNKDICVWDVISRTNRLLSTGEPINNVYFTRDGLGIATATMDNTFRLWSLQTFRSILSRPCFGEAAAFSGDGRRIGLTTGPAVEVCELAGGREWRCCSTEDFGEPGAWQCAWSPDGSIVASAHRNGMRLWDAKAGREVSLIRTEAGETHACRFSPDGSRLFAASDHGVRIWPLDWRRNNSGIRILLGLEESSDLQGRSDCLFVNEDGTSLVVVADGQVRVLDPSSGNVGRTFPPQGGVYGCAASPSGKFCVTWPRGINQPRQVWETASGRIVKELPASSIYAAAFTPDDRWLVTASLEEYLGWETHSWSNCWRLVRKVSGGPSGRVTFSHDGSLGALTFSPQDVRLFEPSSGREYATLEAPEPETISSIAFSPDGGSLATSTQKNLIHIWDLRLIRQELAEMKLDWEGPVFRTMTTSNDCKPIEVIIDTNFVVQPTPVVFPSRDRRCDPRQIDLSAFYNATLTRTWKGFPGYDLADLPPGLQTLAGVNFDIRGVVHVASTFRGVRYPDQVAAIPCRQRCRAIHFLHGYGEEVTEGTRIAAFIIHYEDGSEALIPLRAGENIHNWWVKPGEAVSLDKNTKIAWLGSNSPAQSHGYQLALFKFRWENPRPDEIITSVDFKSDVTTAKPFLVAITLE
jgi:serine/threonine protein kinase/WD40 repeat protein